jgi:hypothetical protein
VTRRNWAFDIAVAAVVGVLGQLEAWWGFTSTHRQGPLWAQALLYAVTAVLLAGRRVNPLACQGAILLASTVEFAQVGAPEGNGVMLPMLVATYTVGRRLPSRRAWWGLVLAAAFWLSWSSLDPTGEQGGRHGIQDGLRPQRSLAVGRGEPPPRLQLPEGADHRRDGEVERPVPARHGPKVRPSGRPHVLLAEDARILLADTAMASPGMTDASERVPTDEG